jgi:hypothetical protein
MGEVLSVLIGWYFLIALGTGIYFRYRVMDERHNDFDLYRYALSWPARVVRGLAASRTQRS